MIDTVAKAIMKWCVPFNDWDAITESQREQFRGAARAAIEAMRRPTEAMIAAMMNSHSYVDPRDGSPGEIRDSVLDIYPAMIDAALTPTDG